MVRNNVPLFSSSLLFLPSFSDLTGIKFIYSTSYVVSEGRVAGGFAVSMGRNAVLIVLRPEVPFPSFNDFIAIKFIFLTSYVIFLFTGKSPGASLSLWGETAYVFF